MKINDRDLEKILKAFANRRRVAMLRYVQKEKEASVGEIAEEVGISFKATSKHIAVLRGAGLLDREQRSLQMYYRLASDMSSTARAILSLL